MPQALPKPNGGHMEDRDQISQLLSNTMTLVQRAQALIHQCVTLAHDLCVSAHEAVEDDGRELAGSLLAHARSMGAELTSALAELGDAMAEGASDKVCEQSLRVALSVAHGATVLNGLVPAAIDLRAMNHCASTAEAEATELLRRLTCGA